MRTPGTQYRRRADADNLGHTAGTPARGVPRCRLGRQFNDALMVCRRFASTPWKIPFNRRQLTLGIALAPSTHLHATSIPLAGDGLVVQPGCRQQDNARTAGKADCRRIRTRQSCKRFLRFRVEYDVRRNSHYNSPVMGYKHMTGE